MLYNKVEYVSKCEKLRRRDGWDVGATWVKYGWDVGATWMKYGWTKKERGSHLLSLENPLAARDSLVCVGTSRSFSNVSVCLAARLRVYSR